MQWRKPLLPLAFSGASLLSGASVLGQIAETGTAQPLAREQPAPHPRGAANIDAQLRRLTQSLDLDEMQRSAVKEILEQRRRETVRLMRDESESDKLGRLQALQTSTVERIRGVLNDEQKKKYYPAGLRPLPGSPRVSVEDWLKRTTPH